MAAVLSVLKHASCPENLFFHFVASSNPNSNLNRNLNLLIRSTFPSLNFKIYEFRQALISSSIRQALENPLNYAMTYLANIWEPCVDHVIYLDSDLVVVEKLWSIKLTGSRMIRAPKNCHAYFTEWFWSDPAMARVFEGRDPCYFNTGVIVMDLGRWREGEYRRKIEWMAIQKEKRIYEFVVGIFTCFWWRC